MAILRGLSPSETVELACRAWDLGIGAVEVPIETPAAVPSLRAAVAVAWERGRVVGAGTVFTPEQVKAAVESHARFTVAPGLEPDVLRASEKAGLPHLPGVATPTDVLQAVRLGCTWVKAFPATSLGPAWFTALRGPFPDVRFVATGGIDARNAEEYLRAGAAAVAVGSALADPDQLPLLAALTKPAP